MDIKEKIFNLLGIKPDEEFKILSPFLEEDEKLYNYRLRKNMIIEYKNSFGRWNCDYTILSKLLNGEVTIKKIITTEVERENIRDWLKNNKPADNLIYKDGLYDQCNFVENTLMQNLFLYVASDYDSNMEFNERLKIIENFVPYVVGTHCSKSVLLPVMEMDLSKIGLKIVLRYNFYDWCISVESQRDIECDFMGLLTDEKGYFEGFPKDRIYEKYSETNKKNFSLCIRDWYEVYTFMFLLRNFLTS